MLRIERGMEKWWPEAGRLVGWDDGKREEWDRRVIGMTAWLHTTSGGHQHQTYRKQIHETHCLSGAADRQPGRQMDGRKNGIGSEWPPSTHNKSALHEEWYRDQKERGAVRASVWRSNIDQWMGRVSYTRGRWHDTKRPTWCSVPVVQLDPVVTTLP